MKIYKLVTSNRLETEIDEDDFKKLSDNIGSGNLIKLKQVIINPSFIVAIVPLGEKKEKVIDGYIDHKRGVFVITKEEEMNAIPDGFVVRKTNDYSQKKQLDM